MAYLAGGAQSGAYCKLNFAPQSATPEKVSLFCRTWHGLADPGIEVGQRASA
jgi:hypothetical protein